MGGAGIGYPSKIGMRITGGVIEVWYANGGAWTNPFTVTDGTYRGNFYAGIGVEDPTAGGLSFTCFGGGRPHRTQIYRVLPALT